MARQGPAPANQSEVEDVVNRVLELHPGLRSFAGKMILEIQPRLNWNKGAAVLWLLRTLALEGPDVIPVYLGDDTTDEDAFDAIRKNGIGKTGGKKRDCFHTIYPHTGSRLHSGQNNKLWYTTVK